MNQASLFKQLTLYGYRYIIGGAILLLLLLGLLLAAKNLAPSGLSPAVIDTVVISSSLRFSNLETATLVNLPFHVLQAASLEAFGLTWWGITLPSTIIALVTAIIFVQMIRRWFRLDIAIITGVMLVTSASFLTAAKSGLPIIMLLFWTSLLLLAATRVVHGSKYLTAWQITAGIAAGLSLYTPLMIYPLIALAIAGMLHPHVRYLVRRAKAWKLVLAAVTFFALILPLVLQAILNPEISLQLLGLSWPLEPSIFMSQVVETSKVIFGVQAAVIGDIPKPFFIAPLLVLAALGLVKTISDHHAARSYLLGIWLALAFIPVFFQSINLYALIIPVMILVAIGLETIIREWYKLFPRNPYARIGGLIPITVLLVVMIGGGIYHYIYGHIYAQQSTIYHKGLSATRSILDEKDSSILLVTSPQNEAFYSLLTEEYEKLTVADSLPSPEERPSITLIHDDAKVNTPPVPNLIITSSDKKDSVILRLYQRS